jgi:hypothetical protein
MFFDVPPVSPAHRKLDDAWVPEPGVGPGAEWLSCLTGHFEVMKWL